jgi:hypothetical protein
MTTLMEIVAGVIKQETGTGIFLEFRSTVVLVFLVFPIIPILHHSITPGYLLWAAIYHQYVKSVFSSPIYLTN